MVFLGFCPACQYGRHEDHYKVTQAVPEGVIGGGRCPCEGECVGRNRGKIDADAQALVDFFEASERGPSGGSS